MIYSPEKWGKIVGKIFLRCMKNVKCSLEKLLTKVFGCDSIIFAYDEGEDIIR